MKLERPTKKLLLLTWLTLVVFHFTILGSAYLNLHWFNTAFIVVLALVQMMLVLLYFMEVRWNGELIWIFAATGFFWLSIAWTLTLSDYLTRQWH
ncbi:MAG TPA: cytochrome C oxidase subunit IV family protein [Verrucomicrobiae bacterium]